MLYLVDIDQLVAVFAQTDFLAVVDLAAPAGVREVGGEIVQILSFGTIQLAAGVHRLLQNSLTACQIQCHRIKGGEHAYIGDNGNVILGVAVAVGADIPDQRDVEMGSAVNNGLGIFCNLVVEVQCGIVVIGLDGLHRAYIDAAAAACTLVPVHAHLAVSIEVGSIVSADIMTSTAGNAFFLVHNRAAGIVHIPLAGTGAGTHTQVLQSAAETGFLVSLEVVQGNDNVGIHNGTADEGFLNIFSACDRNCNLVSILCPWQNGNLR